MPATVTRGGSLSAKAAQAPSSSAAQSAATQPIEIFAILLFLSGITTEQQGIFQE
jgi:hypothetical protein